jgi:hypothetical protein
MAANRNVSRPEGGFNESAGFLKFFPKTPGNFGTGSSVLDIGLSSEC